MEVSSMYTHTNNPSSVLHIQYIENFQYIFEIFSCILTEMERL